MEIKVTIVSVIRNMEGHITSFVAVPQEKERYSYTDPDKLDTGEARLTQYATTKGEDEE